MDVNANLRELLQLAQNVLALGEDMADRAPVPCDEGTQALIDDGCRLAELVEALDGWVRKGGAMPDRWAR